MIQDCGKAEVEGTGQVYRMVESVEKQIKGCAELLTRLEGKLNQVVSPPSPQSEPNKTEEILVPLANHLRALANNQDENNERLRDIISRVQL